MSITTSQKPLHLHNSILNLTFNIDNDKVLGFYIDNNLTWSIHTQFNCKENFFKLVAFIKIERLFIP